jgi:hypothetical protein
MAICFALRIKVKSLKSETWKLPPGAGDTAYEADAAFQIQSYGRAKEGQVPDLAVEVVVSNPSTKALRAGAILGIPELWVLDFPQRRLTFHHLATRGKHKGTYRPHPREPGVPVPDTRRRPGAARRPRGRGQRLPGELPGMGQASPRPSMPTSS